jgi:hypothetical protein
MKAKIVAFVGVMVCVGCGATQVKPKTQTIVFTQGDVVTARADRAEKKGRQVGPWTLPPLPVRLHETSEAFQKGFKAALSAIERPGPQVPSDACPETFDAWLKSDFESWLSASVDIVKRCRALLEKVARGPANEAIVGAALVGLIDEHYDKLLDQIPIPPKLRGDRELIDIYRQELDRVRLPWLKKSIAALVHCVSESSRQKTPLYEHWKRFCAEHAYALDASHHGIKKRVERAEKLARKEAERIIRYGIRPEGPSICWQPAVGKGPLEQADDQTENVSVHAPNKAAVNSPVKSSAPTGPARSVLPVHDAPARGLKPILGDELAAVETKGQYPGEHLPENKENKSAQTATTDENLSPRDAYYGPVDSKTDVRVSIQSSDNDRVSPAPLHDGRVRKRLAACFAKNFTQAQRVTAAVEIVLSVSKRGRVDEVDLKTVDPTAAAYLEPKFKGCLNKALKRLRFTRNATGQGTLISAIVCMRRSAHDVVLQSEAAPPTDAGAETKSNTDNQRE